MPARLYQCGFGLDPTSNALIPFSLVFPFVSFSPPKPIYTLVCFLCSNEDRYAISF